MLPGRRRVPLVGFRCPGRCRGTSFVPWFDLRFFLESNFRMCFC